MSKKQSVDGTDNNPNPQKYSWKKHKVFSTFSEADEARNTLKEEGHLVKVRRCGPSGINFKVVIGSEIKKNTKKKGKNNAAE
jgi:hypothetical protein